MAAPNAPGPPAARPFLKWAGGKSQLLEQLRAYLPQSFGAYHEPFLGGAALFFSLGNHRPALLSDVNDELIVCYRAIRDDVDAVIERLRVHQYERDYFYRVRDLDPGTLSIAERAARTIFLNKTAFNGLYRVNNQGKFNVPFGRHQKPLICDAENLRACSHALRGTWIDTLDFTAAVAHAAPGDLVYFDPPYAPVSATAQFTRYARGGFNWASQRALAQTVRDLTARGVKVMLSNSDLPAVRELYEGFRIESVKATRRINSKTEARGSVPELIVMNY